jgi:acyl-CoA reductase-like NAD-dependent aldehyde dehydrogenase
VEEIMLEVKWPEPDVASAQSGSSELFYINGWKNCLESCKTAVGEALKKWSALGWDKQMESRYPLLSDVSTEGTIRAKIARAAFRQYDPNREWDQLNPQVREDWLQKIKAVMDALKQGLVIS